MCLDPGYGRLKHFRTRSSELFRTYFWRQSLANNFVRLMFVYWIGVTLHSCRSIGAQDKIDKIL